MADTKFHYPRVPEILKPEIKRVHDDHDLRLTQNMVADKCTIPHATFSELVNGYKQVTYEQIDKIVEALHSRHPEQLKDKLRKASKLRETYHDTVLKRLRAGNQLSLTSVDYYPFAGDSTCFFESAFLHFFALAGVKCSTPDNRRGLRPEDYKKGDVALGLFDSADRMLNLELKFWRVPIRMGLGAVCLKKHIKYADSIARILSKLDDKSSLPIHPIVVANDVGAIHCQKRLGFSKDENELTDIPSLDAVELATRLVRGDNGTHIPVVCTDEYTALSVLKGLKEKGVFIFPMNSRRAGQERGARSRQQLPQYYCSIGVNGSEHERGFQSFMQDALVQFLSTEIETTANLWSKLAIDLAVLVSAISQEQMPHDAPPKETERFRAARGWAHAWEWVFYTLNLDSESIAAYGSFNYLPWTPILRRARQLVQKHIAEEKQEMLRDLVELFWESNNGKERLCGLLDVKLSAEVRNLSKPYIISALQTELTGDSALPITVDHHDPVSTSKGALAMRKFMRRLQSVYDEKDYADAVNRLRNEIDDLKNGHSAYGGDSGKIILARLTADDISFIGGACLRRDDDSQRCEIRYLWVDPAYRGNNVGKMIIQHALEVAAPKLNCKIVYVEVIENLVLTAAALFTEMKFIRSDRKPSVPGRAVLERQVTQSS